MTAALSSFRCLIAVLVISGIAVALPATLVQAETKQSIPTSNPKEKDAKRVKVKIGDKCVRRTDNIPGAVKRDGCGRWYCGRTDVKDITEVVPDIEQVAQCTWLLEGQRCLCTKTGASK